MVTFNLVSEFEELNNLPDLSQRPQLVDYCDDIQEMAKDKIGVLFNNEGPLHAAVVMSTIFLYSEKSINIFAKNFNGDVSGVSIWKKALLESFKEHNDLKLNVILEESPALNSKGVNTILALKKEYPGRITLGVLTDRESVLKKAPNVNSFNFTIGDNNKFRLETDKETYKAVCSFDDKETANKLLDVFSILKSYTKDIEA